MQYVQRMLQTSTTKLASTYTMVPKFILSLTLLCLFPATCFSQTSQFEASGNWISLYLTAESTWAAVGTSEKSPEVKFAIRFDSLEDCKAEVTYSKPSPPISQRLPDGALDRALELRVDGNDVWTVKKGSAFVRNGLSVDGTKAVYSLSFFASFEFVLELTSGNYLRMFDRGTEATDRFSLNGSKVSLSRAYSKCKDQIRSRVPEAPNVQPLNPPQPTPAPPVQPKLSTPVQAI